MRLRLRFWRREVVPCAREERDKWIVWMRDVAGMREATIVGYRRMTDRFLKEQRDGLTGQKPPAFCEWVLRCLGASPEEDTLDDLFPGTGSMDAAWVRFSAQPPLFGDVSRSAQARANMLRRTHPELDGFDGPPATYLTERKTKVDRGIGARRA